MSEAVLPQRVRVQVESAHHDGCLDLSKTFVGRHGVVFAAKAAAEDPHCRELVLRDQQLNSDTLRVVLRTLDGAQHLQRLDFGNNPITHAGGRELAVFLRCNPNIVSLQLDGTLLSVAQTRAMLEKVEQNRRMSASERDAVVERYRALRNAHVHNLQSRYQYRLTVSNVRLLHHLAMNDFQSLSDAVEQDQSFGQSRDEHPSRSSEQGLSSSPPPPGASVSFGADGHPLHALSLLAEVIGGGYERLSPHRRRSLEKRNESAGAMMMGSTSDPHPHPHQGQEGSSTKSSRRNSKEDDGSSLDDEDDANEE